MPHFINNSMVWLLKKTNSLDRCYYLLILAMMAAVAGIYLGWSKTPSSALSYLDEDGKLIIKETFTFYESVVKLMLLTGFIYIYHKIPSGHVYDTNSRRVAIFLTVLVLTYPTYINQWEPEITQDSRVVFSNLEKVGYDMDVNQNEQQLNWRKEHIFHGNFEAMGGAVYLPIYDHWGLELFDLAMQTHVFINLLGLSNSFLSQVRQGWVLAFISLIMFLLSAYSYLGRAGVFILHDMLFAVAVLFITLSVFFFPRFMAEYHLNKGDHYSMQGEHRKAVAEWREAAFWKPYLNMVTEYHEKIGGVMELRGCQTSFEVYIKKAHDLLANKDYGGALLEYNKAREKTSKKIDMKYWYASLYNALAVHFYNRQEYGMAEEYWNMALLYVPTIASPYYGLSMVHLKTDNYEKAVQNLDNVRELQQHVTFKRLSVLGQLHFISSWNSFKEGMLSEAHFMYSQYLNK